jgi:LacI family transcriptional regulator
MVTIYDIAKKTGFSPPTVSKALNGTGGLSNATRTLILDTAREMGYTPNMTARTLSTNRSHLIGIIYEDYYMLKGFKHPLFSDILNNFRRVVENAGYDILFLSRTLGPRQMTYLDHCDYRNVDGVLILNPVPGDAEVAKLVNCGRPCVSSNEPFPGICTVVTENVKAADEAVQYLVDLGHRRIAYVSGPRNITAPAAIERLQGYRSCLERNGIAFDESLIEDGLFWHTNAGYEAMKRLLARKRDFTAVFASNDTLASGVKIAAEEAGILIPRDLSLIGFDGDDLGLYMTPRLTTMWQNSEEIGTTAARMLLKKLAGEELPEVIHIPAKLLERDSCRKL